MFTSYVGNHQQKSHEKSPLSHGCPMVFSPGLAACPDVHDALGSARRCRRGVRLNAAWGNHGFFMREIIPFYGFVWKWCIAPI